VKPHRRRPAGSPEPGVWPQDRRRDAGSTKPELIMKNPFFWLAFTCVLCVGAYAFVNPGQPSMEMLKEVTIGVLVGKYALANGYANPEK
jgi:hypothetical protein